MASREKTPAVAATLVLHYSHYTAAATAVLRKFYTRALAFLQQCYSGGGCPDGSPALATSSLAGLPPLGSWIVFYERV